MFRSLRATVSADSSAMAMWLMLSVVVLFVGLTIAGKFESKFGYVIAVGAFLFGVFVLAANGII